eukprot:gene8397-17311_t
MTDDIIKPPLTPQEFSLARQMFIKPERLLFLVDLHEEMESLWDDGKTRLDIVKDVMSCIIRRKANSKFRHQFAIATFTRPDDLNVIVDFSTKTDDLTIKFSSIQSSISSFSEPLDFALLFTKLESILNMDPDDSSSQQTLTRCILIFGRSREIPFISYNAPILQNKYFFLDILYLHHKINEENIHCQEIYDILSQISTESDINEQENPLISHKVSYTFETHPSAIRLYTYVAALLSHPINREHQLDFLEKIEITNDTLENVPITSKDTTIIDMNSPPTPPRTTTSSHHHPVDISGTETGTGSPPKASYHPIATTATTTSSNSPNRATTSNGNVSSTSTSSGTTTTATGIQSAVMSTFWNNATKKNTTNK